MKLGNNIHAKTLLPKGSKKKQLLFSIFILVFLLSACAPATPTVAPTPTPRPMPTGAYLGETPPDATPKLFGYKYMGSHLHSPPVFTPDGTEFYWASYTGSAEHINTMRLVNGSWTPVETLVLSPSLTYSGDPSLSPDGKYLFFMAKKPNLDGSEQDREFIWVAERQGKEWVNPQPLPDTINSLQMHWTMSTTLAGDLYFASGKELIDDIYVSRKVNGEFTQPIKLDPPVNTPGQDEFAPHIAPDGSFLLFTRMETNASTPHLFITYAQPDGKWSVPAQVQNVYYCIAPALTPDGNYVFYLSDPDHISWRDTSFIEELRPK